MVGASAGRRNRKAAPSKTHQKMRAEACCEPQLKTWMRVRPEGCAAPQNHHCLSYLEGCEWTPGCTYILLDLVATEGLEAAKCQGLQKTSDFQLPPLLSSFYWWLLLPDLAEKASVFLSFLANIWKATDFFLALWITLLMLRSTLMKLFPFPQEIFCVNIFLSFPYWFYLH